MMGNKGTGRWTTLLLASFVANSMLIVNSAETALWNEQNHEGVLLAQQLADAAAPLALSRDMVSLSVLASHYENRPGITSVRLYNPRHELIAETGDTRDNGRLFTAAINLQQQALGQVELRLDQPSRGMIVRQNLGNIALSALLHALIFVAGLFLASRTQTSMRDAGNATRQTPVKSMADIETSSASAPLPTPAASADITLLHIALDDPNSLLTRVNANMADELLSLFDQFIDRVARLYGGEVIGPFSPEGVLVKFTQPDTLEREFQALAAAGLFLQLVTDSAEERRNYGRLCLSGKAGVLHGENDAHAVALLAHTAPAGRILSSLPDSMLGTRCRLGASFQLAINNNEAIEVVLLEEFAPEYRQLISNQSQQILGPAETA